MRILPMMAVLVAATLLTGCEAKSDKAGISLDLDGKGNGASAEGAVSIQADNGSVAIDVPGFAAKLKLPGLDLSPDTLDLDGMRLYPGSKITTVNVDGRKENGTVRIGFDSPADLPALTRYYQEAGKTAGYTVTAGKGGIALEGHKPGHKRFELTMTPASTGASGEIVMVGS